MSEAAGSVRVSNHELATVREAMRELHRLLAQLEHGEVEKVVLTQRNQMRAVLITLERYSELERHAVDRRQVTDPRDTTPLSPARAKLRAEEHQARMTELALEARELREAEHRVRVAREMLDSRLYYLHEDGISVTELARVTGLSPETTYTAIDRYRASIPPATKS
jgi:antitoxin (DNA-binding transcriptional repressor) of toxin-antitoxin stability system